jgi:hypothetical protein
VKNNCIKKGKPLIVGHEGNILQKEIEELIDREKTKGRIVSKLLNQTIPPALKTNY